MPKLKRDNVVKVRFTDDELAELDARSGSVNRARFIREVSLGETVETTISKSADPALIAALARIGNNINQLARVANTKDELPTLTELHNLRLALSELA